MYVWAVSATLVGPASCCKAGAEIVVLELIRRGEGDLNRTSRMLRHTTVASQEQMG